MSVGVTGTAENQHHKGGRGWGDGEGEMERESGKWREREREIHDSIMYMI